MDEQTLKSNRRHWNQQQKLLRASLESRSASAGDYQQALEHCLGQHAIVHSAAVSTYGTWSFEDSVLDGMTDAHIRRIPDNCEHSVVWVLWHLARIEDVTMNLLVAGRAQLLVEDNWLARTRCPFHETGNGLDPAAIAELSQSVDIDALRAYRIAVGRRTQQIITDLAPDGLHHKVDPIRVQRLIEEGSVAESAMGIVDYWRKRDIAGLLLMPATRHNFLHLNEALQLKARKR